MKGIIGLIVLIIDIVVILDIIRGNKDLEKRVLWIIAVLFLPILGPILYYVIGKK